MLLEQGSRLRRLLYYSIGLICLCVIMFMLGSTMTLWTMQFALDQTDNSILEGFSVPTAFFVATPAMPVTPSRETSARAKRDFNEHGLLRPPNTTA